MKMLLVTIFGILMVSTLPVLYVVLTHRLRYFNFHYQNTTRERRAWYYDWLLTTRENAAEIKMFGLGNYFRNAFYSLREKLRQEQQHQPRAALPHELRSAGLEV